MPSSSVDYPRGSEWRRWDLHVHTPFSALNNGFGQDFETYAAAILTKAVALRIAAIGLTDYFVLDGYRAMRGLIADEPRLIGLLGDSVADQVRAIALFPNIELRSNVVVDHHGGAGRVNFHLIFDPDLDPDFIEEHFLRALRFTAEAAPSRPDDRWPLTQANLEDLGRRLKEEHPPFAPDSNLFVGMKNAIVAHEDVTKVLEGQSSRFRDRYLFVVAADEDLSALSWDSQAHHARKLFIQKAHMLFSGNPATREFGLGKKHTSPDAFRAEFKGLKPCIHGSDAHTFDALFESPMERHLWIKADPTFQGLRQLLFEPEGRVYIGVEPRALSRAREGATRYMDAVSFQRSSRAPDDAQWFSGSLPLNHGLVAIIGNKGGGKSALADILALLGNSRTPEFAFLSSDRFLSRRTGLGDLFKAEARWHSGQSRERSLGSGVDPTAAELVKYIPQGFLEKVCSELRDSADGQFDHELMEVIFSHVGSADRLEQDNLPDLIRYLTTETEDLLAHFMSRVSEANRVLLDLEAQGTVAHRTTLRSQLTQRRAALVAHDAAQPEPLPEPTADPAEQARTAATREELEGLVHLIEGLDRQIDEAHERERVSALQIAAADRLLDRIANLERQVEEFHLQSIADAATLGIDIHVEVALEVNRSTISQRKASAKTQNDDAKSLLADGEGSLSARRLAATSNTETAREKLDEPTRRYEEYLRNLAGWKTRRAEIVGTAQVPGSITWLEAKVEALKDLPSQLEAQRAERLRIIKEMVDAKLRLLGKYRTLYAPVQRFIDAHPVAQEASTLQFSASIAVDKLVEGFLEMIHQGRRGSFSGEREGTEMLEQLIAAADFSSFDGISTFLSEFESHLTTDRRPGAGGAVSVGDQLRQGWEAQHVYDFVYGLSYLIPRFELRWQGKPIDRLSPGERGNLLLLFYLLIDKRDVPLIIDQPEENLDNHTIATDLIPALKYAKDRRQIIIVTHNPNLAVACDAEQLIYAQIDKADGNRVHYTSGAIEDPRIAQLVVDVLEGTKPLFDIRGSKYKVLDRLS